MTGFGNDPIPGVADGQTPAAPPNAASFKLKVLNGPRTGQELAFEGMAAVLGRSDPPDLTVDIDLTDCELQDSPVISRRHAELRFAAGQLQVVALSDRNGTFVNGERIVHGKPNEPSMPVALKTGDKLTLANLELEVTVGGT